MTWLERWENLKEESHDRSEEERRAAREEKERQDRWHWAMHHTDKSSGSETLND